MRKEREDVIERELQLCGYFAIVTSEKMPSSALNRQIILRKRLAKQLTRFRLTGLSQMILPATWLRPA
ncbi:hypothetical protein EFR66_01050 [Lactobacillus delbrueckii subsp. lactis]|nr:hypothetical protein [Lactobacillus delbrueckii subsp. lactis]MCT3514593.1 hypothetical protein [Lactobacillus delbrueckii subsp. lactis]MCT3520937.1 hypothetical protein [Lactobacillus delbrueckii subsp. lactis]